MIYTGCLLKIDSPGVSGTNEQKRLERVSYLLSIRPMFGNKAVPNGKLNPVSPLERSDCEGPLSMPALSTEA